jgi:hypothetical protein
VTSREETLPSHPKNLRAHHPKVASPHSFLHRPAEPSSSKTNTPSHGADSKDNSSMRTIVVTRSAPCCEDMSQVHPSESDVARPPQVHASCRARDRPFDASAARILRLKHLGGCPLPCRLESLALGLRSDGERPSGIALLGSDTWREVVAAPAILGRELDLHDGVLTVIDGRRRAETGLARRTSRVWLVPINR